MISSGKSAQKKIRPNPAADPVNFNQDDKVLSVNERNKRIDDVSVSKSEVKISTREEAKKILEKYMKSG